MSGARQAFATVVARARHSIGIADSAVSSLGNLLVSMAAAKTRPPEEFGVFATAMLAAMVSVGIGKALFGDVFVLSCSTLSQERRRSVASVAVRGLLAVFLLLAPVIVVVLVGALTLGGASLGEALAVAAAAAVMAPVLSLQDFARSMAYACGLPKEALLNSALWTAGIVLFVVPFWALHAFVGSPALILIWGLTAGVGALVGLRRLGVALGIADPRPWLREHGGLIRRLTLDFGLTQASAESAGILIAAVAGTAQGGLLRIAQIPLSPVVIVTNGILAVLQPALLRRAADPSRTRREISGFAYRIGGAAGLCALALALVLVVLPASWVELLVGAGWSDARGVVPLLGVYLALGALAGCQGVTLRAFGYLGTQVKVRSLLVPVSLAVLVAGAAAWGARGAALALCVGLAMTAVTWAVLLRRAQHAPVAVDDPTSPQGEPVVPEQSAV